ncbi:DRC9-like protein [Mya arenaria]|uniref:Dynein regulatory complex protein 9 n=1 Tax=Mya arenaria TaxID=6604 RepID=A0ABY7FYN1_MYAAR|nr:DRC9-like protein [Mya arenaria]
MSKSEDLALQGSDAIHIATVLEDCVDQLSVLGKIIPASYDGRPEAYSLVHSQMNELLDSQRDLETRYQSILSKKIDMKQSTRNTGKLTDMEREVMELGGDLKNSTHIFTRSVRQNPLTGDNMSKIQDDRLFLEGVMTETLSELIQNCTFKVLADADQLQEMKAKTNMEGKYIKKCAEVSVAQTQKKCALSEKEMKEQIESLRQETDEEVRCNSEIEQFLRTHQQELERKVDFWMEKYEKDVEAKQHELEVLKASKAKDLEKLQELTKLYREYEQVVVEDRIEKEKARRKQEQEAIELKASIKVQSWWRGVMVRKGYGPYAKKKKGKKGKKGKGKKKKK